MFGRVFRSAVLIVLGPSVVLAVPVPRFAGSALWSGANGVDVAGDFAYVSSLNGVAVYDVSDPGAPLLLGRIACPDGQAHELRVQGSYAFTAGGLAGLRTIDVRDPHRPFVAGGCDTPGDALDVVIRDGYALVADSYGSGLQIYSLENPLQPKWTGSAHGSGGRKVALDGSTALLAEELDGVSIVDISDLQAPRVVGHILGFDVAVDVALSGTVACCAMNPGDEMCGPRHDPSLRLFDIADPDHLVELGVCPIPTSSICGLECRNSLAYVTGLGGVFIADLSNPAAPFLLGSIHMGNTLMDLCLRGDLAYVADQYGALTILDVSVPSAPRIAGWSWEASTVGRVVTGSGHAYVADALFGLHVLDLADPVHPSVAGRLAMPRPPYALAAMEPYLCVGSREMGFAVVDVADPADPRIASILATPVDGLDLQSGRAYVVGSQRLGVVDLADPAHPEMIGACALPPNGPCGVSVSGNHAYVANGSAGLQVVDVSVPEAPRVCGSFPCAEWVHAVEADGAYAFASVGNNGFFIFDLSDPEAPRLLSELRFSLNVEKPHLVGNTAYVGVLGEGLVAIDVSDPAHPVVLGRVSTSGIPSSLDDRAGLLYLADTCALVILETEWSGVPDPPSRGGEQPLQLIVPNPTQGPDVARLRLDRVMPLRVEVFDVQGRRVSVLRDGMGVAGENRIRWAPPCPAGRYELRVQAGNRVAWRPLILVR